MKYLCIKTSQARIRGKITTINKGQVVEMTVKEVPANNCFKSVENAEVDFDTMSKDQLMAMNWKFSEIAKFIKDKYDIKFTKNDDSTKGSIIDKLFDLKFRDVD